MFTFCLWFSVENAPGLCSHLVAGAAEACTEHYLDLSTGHLHSLRSGLVEVNACNASYNP